jgi:class 3 adenylate cyclase/tetratricopeptide (TPR) repeat protein
MASRAQTVTILFTDLVGSTELLQRAGDEHAQVLFNANYLLLREAAAEHGGAEVKSLGDGLMVAFDSVSDAVRCAIVMQQRSRRPVHGEWLRVRIGLNTGEALIDDASAEVDYFGAAVVIARRLCDSARPGQILCSDAAAGQLRGHQTFSFKDIGELSLKGFSTPVATCDVLYDREGPLTLSSEAPFVGRTDELARLEARLEDARGGRGSIVVLAGEPGVGKTRVAEEFAERAAASGAQVLRGRCYEGEWAPPFGPFVEAIQAYVREADPSALRADLGGGAPTIARLVPELHDTLPDLPELTPLQPDEERFRLLDATAQFLTAAASHGPIVLLFDDLHWAQRGTLAMLQHVTRSSRSSGLLIVGTYRDVEVSHAHPLADALAGLGREVAYETMALKGLLETEIATLLSTVLEEVADPGLVQAIRDETGGNPFFIREVLALLIEEQKLQRAGGQWRLAVEPGALNIPESAREVIGRRLSRLPDDTNRLLRGASAFSGAFDIATVALATGHAEAQSFDAIDHALAAQLVKFAGPHDSYEFTHALIRHTLYGGLDSLRQVRLHRQIAEALEARHTVRDALIQHAGEIAYQYHRSASLPGAERGVEHALNAAAKAEGAAAWDEQVTFLQIALDLLPDGDTGRARLLARLSTALMWALRPEESIRTAKEAAAAIAIAEGADASAEYLHGAMLASYESGSMLSSFALASEGMRYIGARRDGVWANLLQFDYQARAASDPESLGILMPAGDADFETWCEVMRGLHPDEWPLLDSWFESRDQLIRDLNRRSVQGVNRVAADMCYLGDARRAVTILLDALPLAERDGRIAEQVAFHGELARCYAALGELEAARVSLERCAAMVSRLPGPSPHTQQLSIAQLELLMATGTGLAPAAPVLEKWRRQAAPEANYARALMFAVGALAYAHAGRDDDAIDMIEKALPAIERAPAGELNLPGIACLAAWALWVLQRLDHVEAIERCLRERVVAPDHRCILQDGRVALGRVSALQGRYDDASGWFASARTVLEADGQRPLRAIVDYDEGLMYARRNDDGDRERALPLLNAAIRQFHEIGMDGWVRQAEASRAQLFASDWLAD